MSPITVLLLVPVLMVPDSLQDFLFILYEHIPGPEEDHMDPSACPLKKVLTCPAQSSDCRTPPPSHPASTRPPRTPPAPNQAGTSAW